MKNKQLTKNFNLSEFHCSDGTEVPEQYYDNVQELAENLQVLRDELGCPLYLTNSYRTPQKNESVGGAKYSQHLTASAADIVSRNHTPKQLAKFIERLIAEKKMKQGGLGVYRTFVHYDIRGAKARW